MRNGDAQRNVTSLLTTIHYRILLSAANLYKYRYYRVNLEGIPSCVLQTQEFQF